MLIPVFALVCANMVVRRARAIPITYMPARAHMAVMICLFLLYPSAYPCGGADYTLRMHSMIRTEGNYRGHGSTTMNTACIPPRTYNWIPPAHTFIPGDRQYYVLSLGHKSSELTVLTMARACIYTLSTQVHARRPPACLVPSASQSRLRPGIDYIVWAASAWSGTYVLREYRFPAPMPVCWAGRLGRHTPQRTALSPSGARRTEPVCVPAAGACRLACELPRSASCQQDPCSASAVWMPSCATVPLACLWLCTVRVPPS